MPLYLDTRGKSTVAIGRCDRCSSKVALADMRDDGDKPGMRVCDPCHDKIDAWRLPVRQTEDITLRYPRPDEPLTV